MQIRRLHLALPDSPAATLQFQKNRRLGKKLYLTIVVIVAVVTLTLTLFLTQGTTTSIGNGMHPEWSKTYYGYSGHAIATSDGGYALAASNGSILFFGATERAPTLLKTDSAGQLTWNRTLPYTGHVGTSSIVQTIDGGYALAGTNIGGSVSNPIYSGWLIKTDSQGMVEWNRTFGLPLQTCYGIQDSNGDYVLTGYISNGVNGDDTVLMKMGNNGDLLWTKTFGGNSSKLFALAVVEADDGGYVFAGALDHDGWLAKTTADGNLLWSKTFHHSNSNTFPTNFLAKTSEGGYILTGGTLQDGWLIKTDSAGETEWISTQVDGFVRAVTQTQDGGYVAVGTCDKQAFFVKTDAQGIILQTAFYGQVAANISSNAITVISSDDGGVVLAGTLNQYSPTDAEGFKVTPYVGSHVWLAKLPKD